MAQEAFLRAYRALGSWRREAAFSTWLFALATRLYCSELQRIPARTVPLHEVMEIRDPRAPDGGLENRNRNDVARRAVLTLPSKYRDPLVLYHFQNMDISAAARSLGMAEGTLKARLFRGREVLRKKLQPALSMPFIKKEAG